MQEINSLTIEDPNYPPLLKKIPDAPKVLYYRGNIKLLSDISIAVVGTRRPSSYGQEVAADIVGSLVDAGMVIISGMAPGIDTFAHRICVERSARTIAVLGTGIDEQSIYPQQNIMLSREIIKHGGCIISEFKPGTPGYPNNFRQRNRIVSALSRGVVVVEAKEKSGSLITANYAKLHHKKIFAIPGPIYTLNAKGPNKLIKEGATLVESGQDILDVLEIPFSLIRTTKELGVATSQEVAIFASLKEGSLHIDKIIEKTKLSSSQIVSTLALMEISGKIRNLGGNVYAMA